MDEETYKSVLIINDSVDAHVTLYHYLSWDLMCWMSFKSKIIKPGEKYLHRSKDEFQFKLVARFEDKRVQKTLLELQKWNEDKLFKIAGHDENGSPTVTERELADYPEEKRICLRNLQRDKELKTTCGERNLYDILGLNMETVRKMPEEEQTRALKKGFRTQIRIWHPDHNGGDEEVAKEILVAYEILQDDKKRARYHNLADYDKGWLSLKRYKAIFWPECVTEEQKWAYRKRMLLFALSAVMTVGGIALSISTGGLAPAVVVTGAVFGGGFTGAGFQSLLHTLKKDSVVDECRAKDWLMKAGIGFLGGAATGGAAAGITAGVAGLGSAAVTAGQYMGIGAATGVGGVASSLASDAGRKFVDGENVTWKQVIGHAVCGGTVGAVAGVAGGAVTKAMVILTGARRLHFTLARNLPRMLTENGTKVVMGSVSQFAEERLDDSVENQSPGKHLVKGVANVFKSAGRGFVMECVSTVGSHIGNEVKVHRKWKKSLKRMEKAWKFPSEDDKSTVKNNNRHRRARHNLFKETNEYRHNWREGKCSATYQPPNNEERTSHTPYTYQPYNLDTIFEEDTSEEPETDQEAQDGSPGNTVARNSPRMLTENGREVEMGSVSQFAEGHIDHSVENQSPGEEETDRGLQDGKIKYISKGFWISKMVVKYHLYGNKITQEVRGSGKSIDVPFQATNIEVSFHVWRPGWGDIFKYDPLRRCWCSPEQPHVFRYDTPPIRTFTISGNLWWEKVMTVTNERHEETKELEIA